MRPIEFILAILNLPFMFWPVLRRRPRPIWQVWLPLVAGIVLSLQLALEGYRWQMMPLYILTILSILAAVFSLLRRQAAKARKGYIPVVLTFTGLLVWLLAAALPVLVPVPAFPQPSGLSCGFEKCCGDAT